MGGCYGWLLWVDADCDSSLCPPLCPLLHVSRYEHCPGAAIELPPSPTTTVGIAPAGYSDVDIRLSLFSSLAFTNAVATARCRVVSHMPALGAPCADWRMLSALMWG